MSVFFVIIKPQRVHCLFRSVPPRQYEQLNPSQVHGRDFFYNRGSV
jgi:hypothetical protein